MVAFSPYCMVYIVNKIIQCECCGSRGILGVCWPALVKVWKYFFQLFTIVSNALRKISISSLILPPSPHCHHRLRFYYDDTRKAGERESDKDEQKKGRIPRRRSEQLRMSENWCVLGNGGTDIGGNGALLGVEPAIHIWYMVPCPLLFSSSVALNWRCEEYAHKICIRS